MKILYPIIDGEISGGNIICLKIIKEALKRGYGVAVTSPGSGKFTDILKEEGISVYFLRLKRTFYFHRALILASFIKKEKFNIVHTHCTVSGNILSRLAAKLAGVPIISHMHAENYFRNNPFIRRYQIFLDNRTARLDRKIIAVSGAIKDSLVKQGIVADKIEVIYNGIDVEDCKPKRSKQEIYKEFSLKEGQRLVGTVGRISCAKGQRELILAAKNIIRHFSNVTFMIVGEYLEKNGRYKDELIKLIQDSGISDKVIFTGLQLDALSIMNAFELFVLSSESEGLPVVLLEAMALKKPTVVTAVGGIPEIAVDGSTGIFVPVKDADRLAEAIKYHLKNPDISKRMGENGYERVRHFFSLSTMLDRLMGVYEEVLGES